MIEAKCKHKLLIHLYIMNLQTLNPLIIFKYNLGIFDICKSLYFLTYCEFLQFYA